MQGVRVGSPKEQGAPRMNTESPARLSPLLELPADVQHRVAVAVADAVHPQHLCHLASTCAALRVALAESLAALRGEHQDIKALCIQCRTTLDSLLRKPPTVLWWKSKHLQHQHAAALGSLIGSLIGSGALAQCTFLNISDNQIGDAGMRALADAFAMGAMAQLAVRSLSTALSSDPETWLVRSVS